MPNQRDVQQWLDTVETIATLDSEQQTAVESLIGHAGFAALLGLLIAERQGLYLQLSNMPLVSDSARYQAAVLQGQIRAIDRLPQTLLEIVASAGADA